MPPQTRAAARAALTTFDALPLSLALRIFTLLPADARLLAAAVCRSWRAMLADPALWTRLDLLPVSGIHNPTAALFRAAAARAGGQLETLRVPLQFGHAYEALLPIVAANAGSMRVLTLFGDSTPDELGELLRAAPGLRVLHAFLGCDCAHALPLLRKEPPFGPLRLKCVRLDEHVTAIDWRSLADGLAAHTSLVRVLLDATWAQVQAESDALVGALLSLPQLCTLLLKRPTASVLARLLACRALKSLLVFGRGEPLLDSPASAAVLCDALRANTQLESLIFTHVGLWRNMDAAAALLATLQTRPALKELTVSVNTALPEHAAAAGAALGALIAHSPALLMLDISHAALGDACLGPIMDALPHARHLHTLCCKDNNMSEAFARERLLPAVRACAPLRELEAAAEDGDIGPAVREAQMLLRQRR